MNKKLKRVSMQELDTRLSKIVDEARDHPVAVTRYNTPWVWIVSHNVWVDIEKLKSVVPEGHPLAEVRRLTDADIQASAPLLGDTAGSYDTYMPAPAIFRCLMLQVLFSLGSADRVYDELRFNLLYRWFIGIETFREPLDSREQLRERLAAMRGRSSALDLLGRCLEAVRQSAHAREFQIDEQALLEWQRQFPNP
ncbi:transposase [Alcaligenes sp. WGS1538]|uniref:transposase n=1 Tax=Alcaligenes sp. WGS1538 TaxID=3366811 RepID=UPI00372D75E7